MQSRSPTMASLSTPCVEMDDPVADLVLKPTWYIDRHGVRHYSRTVRVRSGCRPCRVLRSDPWTHELAAAGSDLLATDPALGPLGSIYAIRCLTFSESPGHPNRFHDLTRGLQMPLRVIGSHYRKEFLGLLNASPIMRNLMGGVVIYLFPEVGDEGRFHYHGLVIAPPAGAGAAEAAHWVGNTMKSRWGFSRVQRIRGGPAGLATWLTYMQKDAHVLPELPPSIFTGVGLAGGLPWEPTPDEIAAQLEECRLDAPPPVDAVPPSTLYAWALPSSSAGAAPPHEACSRSSAFNAPGGASSP